MKKINNYVILLDNIIPPLDISFLSLMLIQQIMKKLSNNKSSDLDWHLVSTAMLKNSSYKILMQLYYIILASMKCFYFPKVWRKALILAFPKLGKSQSFPANYKPISLLSTLSKIYEKVIHI